MPKPPIAAQGTNGPIDRVPCPWCGKPNDFRESDHLLVEANESMGQGDPGGQPIFNCDHCDQPMRVASVKSIKIIFLRQGK